MEEINTFENGMHKDAAIAKQPKGTYRDMYNGMLISFDGKHYVVETAKGNRVSFSIPARYNGTIASRDVVPMPIGMISFLDKLMVHSTNNESDSGGYGEIGVVEFDSNGNGTYTAKYHHASLNYSKLHKIEGYTIEESDSLKRGYWTDGYNEGRTLNVEDPFLEEVTSGNIISGTSYMVTNGAVTYDGTNYGPGLVAGNVFVGTATATYTTADASPVVTKYLPYQLLSFTPDRGASTTKFKQTTSGSLYGGMKMYFTRLGRQIDGSFTNWSYGTAPIPIHGSAAFASYPNTEGSGYGGTLANTGKGITITVSDIDPIYDFLEVACAEFDQGDDLIRKISTIFSGPVTGTSMDITHTGTENIKDLDIDDVTLFPAQIKTWKTMTSSKNYNIIGNITERPELDFDPHGVATLEEFEYRIPADSGTLDSGRMQQGYEYIGSSIGSGQVVPDGRYRVTGGVIQYLGVQYGPSAAGGSYFTGQALSYTYTTISGSPLVVPVVLLKKYAKQSGGYAYHEVVINDFYDYKGIAVSQHLRSHWCDETYRLGFIGWDKKGVPYYARWIDDIRMDDQQTKGGILHTYTGEKSSYKAAGIKVRDLKIPADVMANLSGFSIVRAPRDKRIYGQGMIWQLVADGSFARALATPNPGNDHYYAAGQYLDDAAAYLWMCPEELFSYTKAEMGNGNKLETAYFYAARQAEWQDIGLAEQIYSKFYDHATTFSKQLLDISQFERVTPGSLGSSINGSSRSYDVGNVKAAGFAGAIGGCEGVSGDATLLTVSGSINYNGIAIEGPGMGSNSAKPVMNYIKEKSSFYGGQSEDALAKTVYMSVGHFQEINAQVLADTYDSGNDEYVFDEIEIMGGDCYLNIMDVCRTLFNDGYSASYSHGIFYPIESNVNIAYRQGRKISKDHMHNSITGVVYQQSGESRYEDFAYNEAYSSEGSPIQYPAYPANFLDNSRLKSRFRWAGPKILGEKTDSFRNFLVNNFRDVDVRYGEINNVRSRDGKVFYWQENGVGYLPIQERQVATTTSGSATQLGVGGVIDRFDDVNTYFGNQHQHGLVETEYGFCWFDMRRRALLIMSSGGGVQEITDAQGLQTFFNNEFLPGTLTEPEEKIYTTDTPLIGMGIVGVYDPKFKMTLLTFKYKYKADSEADIEYKDFTIGYHHKQNVIVGFFNWTPGICHNHNNFVIAAKDTKGLTIEAARSYDGEVVVKNGVEYINVIPFTTSNPVGTDEQPDFVGSAYWTKLTNCNEIYLSNDGDVCRFFGRVYPFSIEVPVSPRITKPITVDTIEVKSNDVNFNDLYYSNDHDSSSDTNIKSWNRFFKYQDGLWRSNIAQGTKGRLVDMYLKIKFVLQNYTTNPTVSENKQKVIEYITSFYRSKQ